MRTTPDPAHSRHHQGSSGGAALGRFRRGGGHGRVHGDTPPEATARSNAYFEGGYWLLLWDFVYGAAISLLLLNLRWSARMRDLASRLSRFRWIQTLVYWVQYLVVTTILGFPLAWYEGLYREQKYGLATQTLGRGWATRSRDFSS